MPTNAEKEDVEDDTVLETGEDIPPQPKFQFQKLNLNESSIGLPHLGDADIH